MVIVQVSWKADGTRYMMLIDGKDEVYFVDRDNCVYKVTGLTFLHRKNKDKHIQDTVLDGEMVIDVVSGTSFPRFLIYDIVRYEGNEVVSIATVLVQHCKTILIARLGNVLLVLA